MQSKGIGIKNLSIRSIVWKTPLEICRTLEVSTRKVEKDPLVGVLFASDTVYLLIFSRYKIIGGPFHDKTTYTKKAATSPRESVFTA